MTKAHKQTPEQTVPASEQTTDSTPVETPTAEATPAPADTQQEMAERLQADILHWKDLAFRAQADMENLRKRTKIDMDNAVRYANKDFARDLLDVADCLNSALSCAQQNKDTPCDDFLKNLTTGVEMTLKQLETVFKKHQIEKMTTVGTVFNPDFHKVIQEIADDTKPTGTIVQELQSGYTIGGNRVLREAMVIVSK